MKSTILMYFNANAPIVLQCDVSSEVLSAGLMQNGRSVAYTLLALTSAGFNYAKIEK